MKITYLVIAALTSSAAIVACSAANHSQPAISTSGHSANLKALSDDDRVSDFDALAKGMRNYYAPLSYKENRFGFKFDNLVSEYRKLALDAKTDDEFVGVVKQFLAHFHDGHISIENLVSKGVQTGVPIILTPVENRALIALIGDESLAKENNLERGDEVLEVDGKPTMSYLSSILKYEALASDLSDQHLIVHALIRKSYMTDLQPEKPTVTLKIQKPSGDIFERTLIWKTKKDENYIDREFPSIHAGMNSFSRTLSELGIVSLDKMGDEVPFFLSEKVTKKFNIVRVNPSEPYLKKYGITDLTKTPKIFAAIYRHQGKNLLMIRQPTYSVKDPAERIAWFKAVMDEYGVLSDALVLDQTHNPGGSLEYAKDFLSLFAKQDTRNLVNFLHADRAWLNHMNEEINDLKKEKKDTSTMKDYYELGYKLVEAAYDKGLELTETPVPLSGLQNLTPAADFTWKKPVLLLTDELAGSCGDIVPMVMKDNKLATLFGERTMGLGGNVEPIVGLDKSQIKVHLTRGFFVTFKADGNYDLKNPTENNGVTPDIHYTQTVEDFRAGYVGYVEAFSKAADELIDQSATKN